MPHFALAGDKERDSESGRRLAPSGNFFGPEDGTLGPEILAWCRDVVYVPTRYCMNLAATVNVVLYDRAAKQAG